MPAAFLGCGSRLSGSLSRVKPLFSVTRYHHGRHVNYHRKLIRQTFERCVAVLDHAICQVIQIHQMTHHVSSAIGFVLIKALLLLAKSQFVACISSRITTVIHVVRNYLINYGCCNELFAALPFNGLCLDLHGLIFETSI